MRRPAGLAAALVLAFGGVVVAAGGEARAADVGYTMERITLGLRVTVTGSPEATTWIVKSDNKRVAKFQQFGDTQSTVAVRFPRNTGRHSVVLKMNGTVVKTVVVGTGR